LRALSVLRIPGKTLPWPGIPDDNSRLVLVTSHRRESWGTDQEHMCMALKDLVQQYPDIRIVYPVHMNPNARTAVNTLLQNTDRIHLTARLHHVRPPAVALFSGADGFGGHSGGGTHVVREASAGAAQAYGASGDLAVWHGENHRNVA
jgi:UDP-N-acetylglucosamine 2-epimerase